MKYRNKIVAAMLCLTLGASVSVMAEGELVRK